MAENKTILEALAKRWYHEVWGQWDLDVLSDIAQPDLSVDTALGGVYQGFDQFWGYQGRVWGGFRDLQAKILDSQADEEKLTCTVQWTGTHEGHIWGQEGTGKAISFTSTSTLEAKDGKLAKVVESTDLASVRQQVGAPAEPQVFEQQKQRVIPTLRAMDWDESRRFYIKTLGFQVLFEWRHAPKFPVYAGIRKDDVNLHVSEHTGDCQPGSHIAILWPGVDALHKEITQNGFTTEPPADQPWGDRSFDIKDPAGNSITFYEPC